MTTHQANGWNFTLRDDGAVTISRERGTPIQMTFEATQWAEIMAAMGFLTPDTRRPLRVFGGADPTVGTGLHLTADSATVGMPLAEFACSCGFRGTTPCPQHGGR